MTNYIKNDGNIANANVENLVIANSEKMMSSREIADLTEKNHKEVLRDIRRMLEDLGDLEVSANLRSSQNSGNGWKFSTYTDQLNRKKPEYLLNFELTMTLVAGYNVILRNRIIKRWKQLEEAQQQQTAASYEEEIKRKFNIPQDYSAALLECSRLETERQKLAAEVEQQNKTIQLQELSIRKKQELITAQQPKIQILAKISASDIDLRFRQVTKILNINEILLRDWLLANNWTYWLNGRQTPSANVINKGWMKLKLTETFAKDGKRHTHSSMFFTASGLVILSEKLIRENLITISEDELLNSFKMAVNL